MSATQSHDLAQLVCPMCGVRQAVEVPFDACLFFHTCAGCGTRLKPLAGDCCVICSYSDRLCPPRQTSGCCSH